MRAQLKWIQSNDRPSWEEFAANFCPGDAEGGWFSVEIGTDDGAPGSELFQVYVCTYDGAHALKKQRGRSRHVITSVFSPDGILSALREHVSHVSGDSWADLRESLRQSMWWERESIPT